jgi:Zn-dependent protease
MATSTTPSGFRVLGFPVHVRGGFVVFMVLIAALYGSAYGLWLAGAIAVFTLVHELGHASVARWAGAEAEISLEFMAGYAAYRPTRPIPRGVSALIALAGPLIHIAVSTAVLAALGHHPFSRPDWDSTAAQAVWWAGPVIGALNLIPILPLDGGNLATTLLGAVVGDDKAHRLWLYASLAVTVAFGVSAFVVEETRGFTIFVGFLLIIQLQMLFDERDEAATSPFDEAVASLRAGNEAKARRQLVNGLRRPSRPVVPASMTDDEAARLIALLPDPLPTGNPVNEYVLGNLLVRIGRYEDAAHYAAAAYARQHSPLLGTVVARAAAGLRDDSTAIAWLRAAAALERGHGPVATTIDGAPELAHLRAHPDVVGLRRSLSPT